MIVTRQRRKPFPWKRLILPVIALALIAFAFIWTPSRAVITSGPLAPVWGASNNVFSKIAAPFTFAAQNEVITDRNKQIVGLQKQLADKDSQVGDRDKQIGDLKAQVAQLQAQVATANAASPKPGASAAPQTAAAASGVGASDGSSGQASASDLAAGATADMRRTASYWASMEPENAAKVIQKLPVPYVAHILALMPTDTVGAILDALPAGYAAKLTQDHPELKK